MSDQPIRNLPDLARYLTDVLVQLDRMVQDFADALTRTLAPGAALRSAEARVARMPRIHFADHLTGEDT